MPNQDATTNTYEKLSFKDFLRVSKWAIASIYKISPKWTSIYIGTNLILAYNDLIYAYLLAKIIDTLIKVVSNGTGQVTELTTYIGIIIGYKILQTLVRLVLDISSHTLWIKHGPILRRSFYIKLKDLGLQTLEQPSTNDTIIRADRYITGVMPFFNQNISFITEFIKLISLLVVVTKFLPLFTLVLVATYIPYLINDKKMRTRMYKFDWENTEKHRIVHQVGNYLSLPDKLKEIYITNSFNFLDKKYKDFFEWETNIRVKMRVQWGLIGNLFTFLNDIVLIVFGIWSLFIKAVQGLVTVGEVTFWMQIISRLSNSILRVVTATNDLFEKAQWYKEAEKLFSLKPAFEDGTEELQILEKGPRVEIKNLSFNYPDTKVEVIKNLNLKINPGEKIAIVGHNGAGKTTLVKLLARFYKPTGGQIIIDNVDLTNVKIDSLYKNLGVLFQDYNNYGVLSVKENIQIGKPDVEVNEVDIKLATHSADALSFIEQMPNKFDQILTEKVKGGIRPSTGQWQKLALARFFYRDAPLVIFDEPTAAIDPVSEYNIFNKIYKFFKGKTVIIISHRFSTVRNADKIVVMDNGQIVEQGSHEELMKLNGKYANAFNLQAEGYK